MTKLIISISIVVFALFSTSIDAKPVKLTVTSSAFKNGEGIPSVYTCKGKDISPPLAWTGVPKTTKSLVLIMDDPDAPVGTWVHWVYFNIPVTVSSLPKALETSKKPKIGGIQGTTNFRRDGYGGPCPPSGTHRYYFKLYALDTQLTLGPEADKAAVEKAMKSHVVAEGSLMGTFSH